MAAPTYRPALYAGIITVTMGALAIRSSVGGPPLRRRRAARPISCARGCAAGRARRVAGIGRLLLDHFGGLLHGHVGSRAVHRVRAPARGAPPAVPTRSHPVNFAFSEE